MFLTEHKSNCFDDSRFFLVCLFTCFNFISLSVYIGDTYVCLGGRGDEHGSFEKRLSLPWKTEFFKDVLPVSSVDSLCEALGAIRAMASGCGYSFWKPSFT